MERGRDGATSGGETQGMFLGGNDIKIIPESPRFPRENAPTFTEHRGRNSPIFARLGQALPGDKAGIPRLGSIPRDKTTPGPSWERAEEQKPSPQPQIRNFGVIFIPCPAGKGKSGAAASLLCRLSVSFPGDFKLSPQLNLIFFLNSFAVPLLSLPCIFFFFLSAGIFFLPALFSPLNPGPFCAPAFHGERGFTACYTF